MVFIVDFFDGVKYLNLVGKYNRKFFYICICLFFEFFFMMVLVYFVILCDFFFFGIDKIVCVRFFDGIFWIYNFFYIRSIFMLD